MRHVHHDVTVLMAVAGTIFAAAVAVMEPSTVVRIGSQRQNEPQVGRSHQCQGLTGIVFISNPTDMTPVDAAALAEDVPEEARFLAGIIQEVVPETRVFFHVSRITGFEFRDNLLLVAWQAITYKEDVEMVRIAPPIVDGEAAVYHVFRAEGAVRNRTDVAEHLAKIVAEWTRCRVSEGKNPLTVEPGDMNKNGQQQFTVRW